jgi:hypothetical protein
MPRTGTFFAARPPGGAVTFALLIHSARFDATAVNDALPGSAWH